jgi:hypothetical protein
MMAWMLCYAAGALVAVYVAVEANRQVRSMVGGRYDAQEGVQALADCSPS